MEQLFHNKISREDVMQLPVGRFEGEIICIYNRNDLFRILPDILRNPVLGFDTESRPSFKKGKKNRIALIQLAVQQRAYLIRINRLGYVPELWELLTDDRIKKIGIGTRDDIMELQHVHPFKSGGFIELQTLVRDFGIEDASLVKLTAQILGFRVSKSQRLSNWEAEKLTLSQQTYAATDAWVCYMIYRKLNRLRHGTIQ